MSERFETTDLPPRMIARVGLWLAISLIVISIGIVALFYELRKASPLHPRPGLEPPPPRLQISAPADLAALRAREEQTLHSYHWIDRNQKVISIPIDRAIELTAERGLPARTP